jgi:hypothetical protein
MAGYKTNVADDVRRNKMTEIERGLWDKAALTAFGVLLSLNGSDLQGSKEIAEKAYKAAGCFLRARKGSWINQYDAILREYEGIDALRQILELGGNTGRCLDHMVERYAGKPDPLRAYAEENICPRTQGQMAVSMYLEKRNKDTAA